MKRCYVGLSEYLVAFVPSSVKITNPNNVENIYRDTAVLQESKKKRGDNEDALIGLFLIDLVKT